MKPVFIEETITKLQKIIESVTTGNSNKVDVDEITDQIEHSLKAYKDNKENKILFYGTSILIIGLSILLTYTSKSSWPLMFLALWFGGFMYYRVHERSLILNNLDKISKVKYDNPLSKIAYLKSAIDLKVGRKSILTVFLSVLISSAVMMAHYLFVDTSFWMNLGLLVGAIVMSYLFWKNFYSKEMTALNSMKDQLHQLENQIVLSKGAYQEEE